MVTFRDKYDVTHFPSHLFIVENLESMCGVSLASLWIEANPCILSRFLRYSEKIWEAICPLLHASLQESQQPAAFAAWYAKQG